MQGMTGCDGLAIHADGGDDDGAAWWRTLLLSLSKGVSKGLTGCHTFAAASHTAPHGVGHHKLGAVSVVNQTALINQR